MIDLAHCFTFFSQIHRRAAYHFIVEEKYKLVQTYIPYKRHTTHRSNKQQRDTTGLTHEQ
jgi:hypothetical protein